jgi:hypothetical protein
MSPQGRGAVAGLVSLPTSQRTRVSIEADRLRERVSGFIPDKHAGRLARLRRSVGFAARAHLADIPGFRAHACFMLTLTYRAGVQWEAKHLNPLFVRLREWCKAQGVACRYVWVAELQQRGALHYHVALWLPPGLFLPSPDAAGWWPHGSTRTERARGAVEYLMKYLSKGTPVQSFPKGARIHGAGGLEHSMRRAARWLRLPKWVQARSDIFDDWGPAVGGGWWSPEGVCIPSEFVRCWLGDGYGMRRVAHYGRPFDAAGPFCWLTSRDKALS